MVLNSENLNTSIGNIISRYAVSVAIGDNGNILIFEIWWNLFYDLFFINNVADVNIINSFVSERNMENFCCYHEEVQIELV
jgi:hypothetical protein